MRSHMPLGSFVVLGSTPHSQEVRFAQEVCYVDVSGTLHTYFNVLVAARN
jgi:hypothetical protein